MSAHLSQTHPVADLAAKVLAAIFTLGGVVSLAALAPLGDEAKLLRALWALEGELANGRLGVMLERVAGGWRLVVHPDHQEAVSKVLQRPPLTLSRAALEVLTILAYHPNSSRAQVERLRGASVEGVLEALVERGLVEVGGQDAGPGKPNLYRVTERFVADFGLEGLHELPEVR
ncbi:MAG: SMC-Scp complex subunit ScpB [Meiothermus sp.]|nr:SMC-Scp complex subunit ScpB [Meiothermus sp.]